MQSSPQLLTILLLMLSACSPGAFGQSCNVSYIRENGRCVTFGQCGASDYVPGGHVNCFDNIPAVDATSMGTDFKNLLQETCPEYVGGHVCCNYSQINELTIQFIYSRQLFGNCPACLKNFLSHWCAVNCDPDQSMFLTPVSCRDGMTANGTKRLAVTEVLVYLENEYAEDLYRSCLHVQYPYNTGATVIDATCGGAKICNASAWLTYLGDPRMNHNSAFIIQPLLLDPPYPRATQPLGGKVIPCNTVDRQGACECRDCYLPKYCPSLPPHVLNSSYTIMLRAKKPIYSVFQPVDVYGHNNWTFGPVFTKDVLHEAYAIQDYLINMVAHGRLSNGTEVNVSLSDICYQPMAPRNIHCSIISVLNYFQNNLTRLQYEEYFGLVNSSYHIYHCTRNPTAASSVSFQAMDMSCLGAFGGPIYPELALKGYNYIGGLPNYINATDMDISFVVKHLQLEELAVIWEEALLDYVSSYYGKFVDIVSTVLEK